MWQSMGGVDHCAVTHRAEIADTHGVHLSPDGGVVPDCGPLADDHISNQSCIWGYPGVLDDWNTFI